LRRVEYVVISFASEFFCCADWSSHEVRFLFMPSWRTSKSSAQCDNEDRTG
jgi:hypothetical protein